MFSFFRRADQKPSESTQTGDQKTPLEDNSALIAVITAAIARFREQDGGPDSPAGFVVKRIRRI